MHESKVRDEWPRLVAAMRAAMERRVSPRHPEAQELARRWMDLLRRTVVEDFELLHDYDGTQRFELGGETRNGVDAAMFDYLSAALWARHLTLEETERLCSDGRVVHRSARLLAKLRAAMNRGAPVTSPAVQRLYGRWESAVDALTGGDRELRRKWFTAARSDPDLLAGAGVDTRLQNYLRRASLVRNGLAA